MSEKKVSVLRTTVHTAAPLVFSALAQAANHISDRFFLSKASGDALAAVLPGGMLAIMFSTVIMTAIGYSGTVIASGMAVATSRGRGGLSPRGFG